MRLPSVKALVPRHTETLGISCQPDTTVINISANLAVAWNGLLKKWNFKKNPMFALGSPRCSDVWLVGCSRLAGAGDVPLPCVGRRALFLLLTQHLVSIWLGRQELRLKIRTKSSGQRFLVVSLALGGRCVLNTCLLSSYTKVLKAGLPAFPQ